MFEKQQQFKNLPNSIYNRTVNDNSLDNHLFYKSEGVFVVRAISSIFIIISQKSETGECQLSWKTKITPKNKIYMNRLNCSIFRRR